VASFRYTWFGLEVALNPTELNTITSSMNGGANAATLTTAALVAWGITAPASVVSAIVAGILGLGAAALGMCNAAGRGVVVTVLWVGLPWCRSQ